MTNTRLRIWASIHVWPLILQRPSIRRMARDRFADCANVEIVEEDILVYLTQSCDGTPDIAVFSDTLASIPVPDQKEILTCAYRLLRPGGQILIKIVDTQPAWKVAWSRLITTLVYRGLRLSLSAGQRFYHQSAETYSEWLEDLGAETIMTSIHRAGFPHVLITGTKR